MPDYLRALKKWLASLFKGPAALARRVLDWLSPADELDAAEVRPVVAEPEFDLSSGEPPKYRVKRSLSSGAELNIYRKLCDDVGRDYQVFTKVRLGDILHLANEPANRKYHNNQIQCKHFDFVLCHLQTHQPLLAIELDDNTHDRFRSIESDAFKDRICAEAGLPLLRLDVRKTYAAGSIAAVVSRAMSPSGPAAHSASIT